MVLSSPLRSAERQAGRHLTTAGYAAEEVTPPIARHGRAGVRVIVGELTADCPGRDAAPLMERGDPPFPELPPRLRR
jgi:hypothetical protein